MRVSWIVADEFADPVVDPDTLASIGSTWGSWRTWRAWNTDNVLCYDTTKARDLVTRAFQAVCNLYVRKSAYADLGRPAGVQLFVGEFPAEFDSVEEIIAMHLLAGENDLVLLLGYNLGEPNTDDAFELHKRKNYLAAFASAIKMYPETQWVIINHDAELASNLHKLENITCDTYENVLQLLG